MILNSPSKYKSKVALITGSSSGFGKWLTHLLVYDGWTVIGIARREDKLLDLKETMGERFYFIKCDVSDPKQVAKSCNKIKKEGLIPSLLFLNAGIGLHEDYGKLNIEDYKYTFNTNYYGAISWVEYWLPYLLKDGGTIVGTSSVLAKQAVPNSTAYCASKAALASTFESWRIQYKYSKVNFITVFPGPMKTDLLKTKRTLPFTQNPMISARYVLKKVFSGKETITFPFPYKIFFSIVTFFPTSFLHYLFKKFSTPFDKKE